jgi:hypothetical protein
MFELKMDTLKQGILSTCLFAYSSLFSQEQTQVDFIPSFKKGDKMVYQLVETKFKQNPSGHFLYLMFDTSYMVFNVTDKNDSQTLVDFNYADAIVNGQIYNETPSNGLPNPLRTETYKLVLDKTGKFIEVANWEFFGSILIQNLKFQYKSSMLDSNTLKYYYLYYHNQENVENAVIPRVLDLIDIFGKSYILENNYSLAREIVNPFKGRNLLKSCTFKPFKDPAYPNSVFFKGQVKTNDIDNECLQEDYYAFIDEKKPDDESEIVPPYIYMQDSYSYQWGTISKRIITYTTTHTVWLGEDKQGLDRMYTFYAF